VTMAEIIEVKVQGDPEEWLAKAKKAAAEKGVALRGETESGVGGAATSWFCSRRRPLAVWSL